MAKPKLVLTPEQIAELKRLYEEFPVSTGEACRAYGMHSPEFLKADAEFGAIKHRIADLERTNPDNLVGGDLQLFVTKLFDARRQEIWPAEINAAVEASCEVKDGQLLTNASIGEWGTPEVSPVEATTASIEQAVTQQLTDLLPILREFMSKRGRP